MFRGDITTDYLFTDPLYQEAYDKKLAELEEARAREVQFQARLLGIDDAKVKYKSEGGVFELDGKMFTTAGEHEESTGEITIYSSALNGKDKSILRDVLAHENAHGVFFQFLKELKKENSAVMTILGGNPKFLLPDGGIRDPEMRTAYKAFTIWHEYFEKGIEKMASLDGVSPYSASWWNEWKEGGAQKETVIGETFAEIAGIGANGSVVGRVAPEWIEFYRRVKDYVDGL